MTGFDAPTLHGHVPPFIALSGGPLLDDVPQLNPDEWASLASMAPMSLLRLAEFAQGRQHARKALTQLGMGDAGIPVGANRSPVWPKGFVGSISHVPANPGSGQPGWIMATAARSVHCTGLGIDVERTDAMMPEHWQHYMSQRELAWICVQPMGERNNLAHGIWSAKEASIKALTLPLAPQDIEVRLRPDIHTFEARCQVPRDRRAHEVVQVGGWLSFGTGWVVALAALFQPVADAPPPGHQPGG